MFKLVVSEKGGPTKEIEFDKDEVTIGRVPGNDIVLPGNNVSKRHSRVVRQDGRFFVVDLKSTNGTYLNGRRIMTPSPLRAGDKIFVGSFVLVLEGEGAEAGGGDDASDIPAEGASLVEPIPLDQEPIESQPPPAPEPVGRPTFANPLNAGPRAAMQTQPLSTGPAIAATMAMQQREQQTPSPPSGIPRVGSPPAASSSRPVAPTSAQPGPGTPSSPGAPPIGAPRAGSIPTMNAGSPTPGALPGARPSVPGIAARSPVSGSGPARPPSGNWPPTKPPATVPATAPTMPEPVDEPGGEQPSTPPPAAAAPTPAPVAAAPAPVAPPPTTTPPPPPAAAPAPEPAAARAHPSTPTITVGSKVVDQVIQAHRASVEPTPPGNEYAALLASIIADALEAGVSANPNQLGDSAARARARSVVDNLARGRDKLPTGVTSDRVSRDAVAEIVGAGPIELALEEPDVTSVLVAPSGRVLVGRGGAEGASPFWFSSSAAVATAVDRLLHATGVQRIGEQPFVECVLPDAIGHGNARMTVVYAPGAAAPSISIERAGNRASAFAELVAAGVLSAAAQRTITMALEARRNVFIVGPRGSARSTLLGTVVAHLAGNERVVALEARPELSTIHRELSVVPITKDPKRSLDFAHALRPHRLVFAQVDDAIASALVGTLVTGSEGTVAVLEGAAGSTALAHLAAATGSKDEGLARIQSTRPFVVQLARLGDGSARVASLGEARVDGGHVVIDELFVLRVARNTDRGALSAELVATGTNPSFGG